MADETTEKVKETGKSDFFKIILIGVVLLVIAMGSSYLLLRNMLAPLLPENKAAIEAKEPGNLVKVGDFTTNIGDVAGTRYVKVEVTVGVSSNDKKAAETVSASLPIIKDCVLNIISSKTIADFDPRNRENLKNEIKNDINSRLGSDIIKGVYFEGLIIQ